MGIRPDWEKERAVTTSNKTGNPPHSDFHDVVGGWNFPVLILYLYDVGGILKEWKRFVLNNYDQKSILVNFIEERIDTILADGNLKRYRKGWRLYCEIGFHALQQLDTTFDQFLADMHNADRVDIIPHKDHAWKKYAVVVENGWEYTYFLNKPYQGWEGVVKLRGIKRLTRMPLISQVS